MSGPRSLGLAAAMVLSLAGSGQTARAADDRITASPTLPKTDGEKQGDTPAADAFSLAGLKKGQMLYSADGFAAARITDIVRDKAGKPVSIILTTPDGKRRYAPADDLGTVVRGRAATHLTRAEIQALPQAGGALNPG